MGVPGAAPTSWVSCWDRSLLLPVASRSTSVTDTAASGATNALAGPCPGPDPPGVCLRCVQSSPPSQPPLGSPGHVPFSIIPAPDPAGVCWMCPSVTPRPAGAHLGPVTSPQPGLWGRVTVWGHHRGRGEDGARGHRPATDTAPAPSTITGMGTRGQHIPGHPEPRGVPVPVPCLPAAPPALPMSPRLRPYKVGTDSRGRPVCTVNPAALPLLTVNTSTAPARPLSHRRGDRLTPSPSALDGDHRGPLAVPSQVTRRGDAARAASRPAGGRMLRPWEQGWGASPVTVSPTVLAVTRGHERVLVPARRHRHRAARRQPAFSPKWFLSSPQTKTLFILNQWAITGKWQRSPRGVP